MRRGTCKTCGADGIFLYTGGEAPVLVEHGDPTGKRPCKGSRTGAYEERAERAEPEAEPS